MRTRAVRFGLTCAAFVAVFGFAAFVIPTAAQTPRGAAILLSAHREEGSEAIDVSGRVQPLSVIELIERAKLSWELPVVTLSRFMVMTDDQGHFAATLPLAPDYVQTSVVYVEARNEQGTIATVAFTVGRIMKGPPIALTDNPGYQEYH